MTPVRVLLPWTVGADGAGAAGLSAAELFGSPLKDVINFEGVLQPRRVAARAHGMKPDRARWCQRPDFKPHGAVRGYWLAKQTIACRCFLANAGSSLSSSETPLARLIAAVPPPDSRTEDLLLRSALARLLVVLSTANCSNTRCLAMAETVLDILLNEALSPSALKASRGVRVSRPTGQPKGPKLTSVILRRSLSESVDLHALAREFGCTDRLVRMAFEQAYGMSPRTYRRRTRVLRAIGLLRKENWDNETVAREVGFRSPKNLYRALRGDTGLTPRQIRRLSEDDLQRVYAKAAPAQVATQASVKTVVGSSPGALPGVKVRRTLLQPRKSQSKLSRDEPGEGGAASTCGDCSNRSAR